MLCHLSPLMHVPLELTSEKYRHRMDGQENCKDASYFTGKQNTATPSGYRETYWYVRWK